MVKVTFMASPEDAAFLEAEARKRGGTVSGVVQSAVNSEKFFNDAETWGKKVLVEVKPGRLREVVRR